MTIFNFIKILNRLWQKPVIRTSFLAIKLILIFSFFYLLIKIIYYLSKTSFLRMYLLEDLVEFLSFKPYGATATEKKWQKIKSRLQTDKEEDFKVAVIEANLLLNDLLKGRGCQGTDVKEKLERLGEDAISNFDEFIQVYETYKCVTEDPSYRLSKEETRKFLEVYEGVMKDLGFLP